MQNLGGILHITTERSRISDIVFLLTNMVSNKDKLTLTALAVAGAFVEAIPIAATKMIADSLRASILDGK